MIFNVSGGGGTALNFRVVGNPKPQNPKDNCIWLDTNTEITSYIFSAEQPTHAQPGMVWISVGTSSPLAFSATKKNPIMVYPLSAKQYIGGAWDDKPAEIWQYGSWVEWWDGYIYKNGDERTNITGGWTTSEYTWGGKGISATKNADRLSPYFVGGKSNGGIGTVNKVSVKGKSTLSVAVNTSGAFICYISSSKSEFGNNALLSKQYNSPGSATLEVPIPSTVTEGYVVFFADKATDIYSVQLK